MRESCASKRMLKAITVKAAMVAPTISIRANRGPDIPRFQRPMLNVQRPRPDEEKREVKKPNTEHRTPNAEHQTPNGDFCGVITCCAPAQLFAHWRRKFCSVLWLQRGILRHDGRIAMFRI